jgi:hypothetical protein
MPDLWDTNPDHVFSTPDKPPDPAPSGHEAAPAVSPAAVASEPGPTGGAV